MLHRSRFVMASLLVVLTSAIVSYAVAAAVPNSLIAAGRTRYAVAQGTTTLTTFHDYYQDVTDLSTTVKIPSGKHGDVMVAFCGQASSVSLTYARAIIGSAVAAPGEVVIHEGSYFASNCALFYKVGVSAGSKTVKIQWRTFTGGMAQLWTRSMIVTVNIR